MSNYRATGTDATFVTRRYTDPSMNPVLVLLAPWQGLPAGTKLRPLSGGYSNTLGGPSAVITVLTGPRAGEQVEGLI